MSGECQGEGGEMMNARDCRLRKREFSTQSPEPRTTLQEFNVDSVVLSISISFKEEIMMKRVILFTGIIFLMSVSGVYAGKKLMSLQIKTGSLRTSPTFLGKMTTQVNYGDRLTVEETKGDWSKVAPVAGGASGWIHNSAITKKRIKLSSSDKGTDAEVSSGELALAGKGFNSDVEAKFKSKNADIDFTWIDRMEKIKVSHTQMQSFLKTGNVVAKGGAK